MSCTLLNSSPSSSLSHQNYRCSFAMSEREQQSKKLGGTQLRLHYGKLLLAPHRPFYVYIFTCSISRDTPVVRWMVCKRRAHAAQLPITKTSIERQQAGEKEALAFLSLNMFWTTTTLRSVSLLLLLRVRLTLLAMQYRL